MATLTAQCSTRTVLLSCASCWNLRQSTEILQGRPTRWKRAFEKSLRRRKVAAGESSICVRRPQSRRAPSDKKNMLQLDRLTLFTEGREHSMSRQNEKRMLMLGKSLVGSRHQSEPGPLPRMHQGGLAIEPGTLCRQFWGCTTLPTPPQGLDCVK